jgi:hypothetical protein
MALAGYKYDYVINACMLNVASLPSLHHHASLFVILKAYRLVGFAFVYVLESSEICTRRRGCECVKI